MLATIWNRYYDQMSARVNGIEEAIAALATGSLTSEDRLQAWQSAHTLAGALGTFGLPEGSQVAKQIESLLDAKVELTPAQFPQLQQRVAALRETIESKMAPQSEPSAPASEPSQLLVIAEDEKLGHSLQVASAGQFEAMVTTNYSQRLHPAPQAIVLDLECFAHSADSWKALAKLEANYPAIPLVILSQPDRATAQLATNSTAGMVPQVDLRHEVVRKGGRIYLSKPIAADTILQALARFNQPATLSKSRITILDTDRLLLAALTAQLLPVNVRVTALSEPSRFWETLESSQPDLLILDLDMPMNDGMELYRSVRSDPRWANLPMLFLTTQPATISADRVFAADVDAVVAKPIATTELVNQIVNRLKRIE